MTNEWLERLTALAFAYGEPSAQAKIKMEPADFRVTENMLIEPTGEGEHVWLKVRKTRQNTPQVAKQLAMFAGVTNRDIGYSGMKDYNAVTEQWFSVWKPVGEQPNWQAFTMDGVELLHATRHSRKIKRGTHKTNHFVITLREVVDAQNECLDRLKLIKEQGVPNYFGPQRFGRECDNMRQAEHMLLAGRKVKNKNLRGILLSSARSWLFNHVVSQRVANDTWNRLSEGEPANLHGTNSVFYATGNELDRLQSMDIHPTAPLVGSGASSAMESCMHLHELESAWLAQYSALICALQDAGLQYQRRSTRLSVPDLTWETQGDSVTLVFSLLKGQFATSVLRELVTEDTFA